MEEVFLAILKPVSSALCRGICAELDPALLLPRAAAGALGQRFREHFRSTRDVARALTEAFRVAMGSIEVALSRPWMPRARATRELADLFEKEFLTPFAREHGLDETALRKARKQAVRGCRVLLKARPPILDLSAVPEEKIAAALAAAAVLEDGPAGAPGAFGALMRQFEDAGLLGPDHPLAAMLRFRGAFRTTLLWAFDQQVKKSPELARYLERRSLVAIEGRIAELQTQLAAVDGDLRDLGPRLEEALDEDRDDLLQDLKARRKALRRQREHIESTLQLQRETLDRLKELDRTLDRLEESTREASAFFGAIAADLESLHGLAREHLTRLDEVKQGVDELRLASDGMAAGLGELRSLLLDRIATPQEIEEALERALQRVLAAVAVERQVKPRDTFVVHASRNLEELRRAAEDVRTLQSAAPSSSARRADLLLDVGSALNSAQEPGQATAFFREATNAGDSARRALAFYDLYVTELSQDHLDEALDALRQAWQLDPAQYLPFDVHQYEPQAILGAGGMGVAFLCQRLLQKDRVVVKTFWDAGEQPEGKLFQEAFLLQQAASEHVVRPLGASYADPVRRQRPYLVQEYFDGEDGERRLARLGHPLPVAEALAIAEQVASALVIAHERGVCHLDLKPANLLIREDEGRPAVKVIDFGLARSVKIQGIEEARKSSGSRGTKFAQRIFGTLDFAPPEQLGERPDPPGPRSDVYAFGTTLARLLTARSPRRVRERDLPPILELRDLIAACTEEDPAIRPASPQLLTRVRGLQAQTAQPRRPGPLPRIVLTVAQDGRAQYSSLAEAVAAAPPGALIRVRPGTYEGQILLDKPLEIAGDGPRDEIQLHAIDQSCLLLQTQHATVRGLSLSCRASEASSQEGEDQQAGAGSEAAETEPTGEDAAEEEILCPTVDIPMGGLVLEDCRITSELGPCVRVHGPDAAPVIRNCIIHDVAENGLEFSNRARGTIEGCDVYGNYEGLAIATGADPTVKQCKFHENRVGVTVDDNGRGTLEECDIFANGANGGAGLAISRHAHPTVRKCKLHDEKHACIWMAENSQGTFEDCDIFGNEGAGLFISGQSNPTLRRCKFHDGKTTGIIVANNGQGMFEDCDIFGNTEAGLVIEDESNPTLRHCKFHDGKSAGILITTSSQGTIENCDISGNQFVGLQIATGGNPTVRNCKIHDGKSAGIAVVENGRGTFEDCDVFGNEDTGLGITDESNPTLRRCKFRNGKFRGIWVNDNGQGILEGCDILENTKSGLYISTGGNPTVQNCKIRNGKSFGIWVDTNGQGTIEDCDISGNEKYGLCISSSGNPIMRRCKISEGKLAGIFVSESGQGSIEECDIFENQESGVLISTQANPTLRRCQINRNAHYAVQVIDKGSGSIEDCDLTGNRRRAWKIEAGCTVRELRNREDPPLSSLSVWKSLLGWPLR